MLKRFGYVALATVAIVGEPAVARAALTTVDISGYVNSNFALGEPNYPTGTTTGNQGTGIPFDVAPLNGEAGTWLASASSTETLDVHVHVSGEASFYALLNNYYGTPGADEYDITIKASNGDKVTYQSIGGVNTRDYNANIFTNTIADTTMPWFNNGDGQRLDLREFSLPPSFFSDTITDFMITQVDDNDPALFTGLTFSTSPIPTPEPASIVLFGSSLLGLGLMYRRRRPI